MAVELLMICEKNKLVAADPVGFESLEAMREGEYVTAKLTRTRNPGHHRKFFALLNIVYEAQERFATMEQLLNFVKIATGHCDVMEIIKGKPIYVPRSISFAKMDQAAFEQFYNSVVKLIVTKILPGVDSDDLERQVLEIIA